MHATRWSRTAARYGTCRHQQLYRDHQRRYSSHSNDAYLESLSTSILSHDRAALARAITLLESNHIKHQQEANQLMTICETKRRDQNMNDKRHLRNIRIGISGAPGVGKSTFIEQLGQWIVNAKQQKTAESSSSHNHKHHPSFAFSSQAQEEHLQQQQQQGKEEPTQREESISTEANSSASFSMPSPSQANRLAILTIDPSSHLTGGSILGDRTRMPVLSSHPDIFIRASPSKLSLGGTHTHTFSVLQLCELADYNMSIIETVGVGQSEVRVRQMVDVLILLVQPGAGDELQGMKKGIVELADIIVVNKADGALLSAARHTYTDYKHAMNLQHTFRQQYHQYDNNTETAYWKPKVLMVSSIESDSKYSVKDVWDAVIEYDSWNESSGRKAMERASQQRNMLREQIPETFYQMMCGTKKGKEIIKEKEESVMRGEHTVRVAAQQAVEHLLHSIR